jgi:hypothetical protein
MQSSAWLGDENDPLVKSTAFTQALANLGWTDGRNVRMAFRWAGTDINRIRALAKELVGLQPDIILTGGTAATAAVQRETRTIPIVFANVGDPVASGFVAKLSQPSGNITGFVALEVSLRGPRSGAAEERDIMGTPLRACRGGAASRLGTASHRSVATGWVTARLRRVRINRAKPLLPRLSSNRGAALAVCDLRACSRRTATPPSDIPRARNWSIAALSAP